ncbi:MAG: hypothetical protein C3F11_11400 [Methylocystaceae bacterium]|nr:MAG: hypothetical protein C3F11_11400 [Methylocystaceae bacterium]
MTKVSSCFETVPAEPPRHEETFTRSPWSAAATFADICAAFAARRRALARHCASPRRRRRPRPPAPAKSSDLALCSIPGIQRRSRRAPLLPRAGEGARPLVSLFRRS